MKIAILSDTHDNLTKIDQAARIINEKKPDWVLHLGDWCAPFSVLRLGAKNLKSVLGNNDGDLLLLAKTIESLGGELLGEFAVLEMAGKKLALLHGQHPTMVEALAASGRFDYLLVGHTHQRSEEKVGKTLIINPGYEFLAWLSPEQQNLEFLKIV
jgi:putative phosphoesterase